MDRVTAIARLRRFQPLADEIRFEGKCHVCKRKDTMYSYQLASDHPRGKREETCGFYCVNCHWGNGGSRTSIDTEDSTDA